MVGVAQSVELPVVVRTVAGSNPVAHPWRSMVSRENLGQIAAQASPYFAHVAQLVRGGDLKNH